VRKVIAVREKKSNSNRRRVAVQSEKKNKRKPIK
jgi:hypothetical protein